MYTQTASIYDVIYKTKDYSREANQVHALIQQRLKSPGNHLLDLACGTGRHLTFLQAHYTVEGLDLQPELLGIARRRLPDIPFHLGDMSAFSLDKQFDVITCLFSSIGYLKTLDTVRRSFTCMAKHLAPGGITIVEPWFTPAAWHPNTVHSDFTDEPELKIARINTSYQEGRLSYFDLHYLIGTPVATRHYIERHELGLFEVDEMRACFVAAGLEPWYDPEGLTGRGLWVASKPL